MDITLSQALNQPVQTLPPTHNSANQGAESAPSALFADTDSVEISAAAQSQIEDDSVGQPPPSDPGGRP
ncbi:hypothetical protein [Acanthopleuribacter pedis]|uniref:Uncharacterized protein n=1 Tax=Acanthopleuribacter pedis TaxID=442870 RepID=A0A8J7QEI0_9BACT|nr:hypothetical protein [Acanthopleuribacter pedis]MBO1323142.1 hypothetical protein [Acanthopleuribacter pedis]